jgi:hypothetical protein
MPSAADSFSRMMPITTGVDATVPDGRLPRGALGVREPSEGFWASSRPRCRPPCRARASARAREFLGELVSHASFKKCTVNAGRTLAHLLVFYGFVGAFIATNIVLVYEWGPSSAFSRLEDP